MTKPDLDTLRQAAGLNPLPHTTPAEKPETNDVVVEDRTLGNEEALRGIPVVGRVPGTIKGTRPGDPAHLLEQAGRDILQGHLQRTRRKDHP